LTNALKLSATKKVKFLAVFFVEPGPDSPDDAV